MIAVVGCGNPNRCDDGVGPEILRRLQALGVASDAVRLIDAGTDGMAAMFAARGCAALIIVDACRSGAPAGARFELPGSAVAQPYAPSLNLHDFRWDHALHAGRLIFREAFPADVTVLLVEAGSVAFGIGLSPAVATAAEVVTARVLELVRARLPAAA